MAERRMFAKSIISSDAFIDMPVTARLLYYDLGMRADDDGFVNSPKSIMRSIGASLDDLKILIAKKFILDLGDGIVVVKHWRIHNYIRKDSYNETKYKELKALLELDENNSYRLLQRCDDSVTDLSQDCDEVVTGLSTQDRIGKDRIGKDRIGKREGEREPTRSCYGIYNNVRLSEDEIQSLVDNYPTDYAEMINNLSVYMRSKGKFYADHYATMMKWAREDATKNKTAAESKKSGKDDLSEFYSRVAAFTQEDTN